MAPKWFIWFCIFLGSSIGSFVPMLWGDAVLSFASVIFSGLGAFAGIWFAFRIGKSM